jgi:hypothetical protein
MRGTESRRARDGILVASGAALMLAVLLVVQSFVGSGLLSTKTATVTVRTSDAYEQVQNAYASHMMELSTRNPSAAVSGYESNATVEWTGVVLGLTGSYSGAANIKILLGSFTGKLLNFSLSNEYQSIGVKDNVSVVNSTFNFQGYSTIVGKVNGTVLAQDTYEHVGNSWLIAHEMWNFTQYHEQFYVRTG